MCLIASHIKPKVAEEDIVCYKILQVYSDKICSPYMEYKWKLGKVRRAWGWWNIPRNPDIEGIQKGCFHSFETLDDAVSEARVARGNLYVYECVIPKGTKYWAGTYSRMRIPSYASRKLKVVKKIEIDVPKLHELPLIQQLLDALEEKLR